MDQRNGLSLRDFWQRKTQVQYNSHFDLKRTIHGGEICNTRRTLMFSIYPFTRANKIYPRVKPLNMSFRSFAFIGCAQPVNLKANAQNRLRLSSFGQAHIFNAAGLQLGKKQRP